MVLVAPVPSHCLHFTSHKQDVTSKVPLLVVGFVFFPNFLTIFCVLSTIMHATSI